MEKVLWWNEKWENDKKRVSYGWWKYVILGTHHLPQTKIVACPLLNYHSIWVREIKTSMEVANLKICLPLLIQDKVSSTFVDLFPTCYLPSFFVPILVGPSKELNHGMMEI